MKWLVCLFAVLMSLGIGKAESLENGLSSVLDKMELAQLEEAAETPELSRILLDLARGNAVWDTERVLETLKNMAVGEFQASFQRMMGLIAPGLLCALMGVLREKNDGVSRLAESASFLALAAVMASDLKMYLFEAEHAVNRMSEVMQLLFPLLMMLLASVGATHGAALFQPAISAASGTMTALVRSVSLPLCTGMAIVLLLDSLSDAVRLKRLAMLLKSVATWTLGIAFTVFIGVTAMQGLAIGTADGVSIRAAKYAVDHFVPVVGGMFADTMDTMVGCSLLIKNALGVTGLILILSVAGMPMIRTLCSALMYRACAALLQPLAQERVAGTLHGFSDVLMLLFAIQLSVGAMFFLLVAQVLAVGNMTVMLR